jgi:RNA polymerase sigma factor (TIGR02999 family)
VPRSVDLNNPERQRAFAELIGRHYPALRDLAARTLRAEHETLGFGAAALAPTSLVTETVLRLMKQDELPLNDRHLRGLASVFMTRVIADRRRARLAQKRDARVTQRLDTEIGCGLRDDATSVPLRGDLELLEQAMIDLASTHPREMEVVTLHSVAGLGMDVVADLVNISVATAHRDLVTARSLLARKLRSLRADR